MSFRRKRLSQKLKNIVNCRLLFPTLIGNPVALQLFTHLDSRLRGSDEHFRNTLESRNDRVQRMYLLVYSKFHYQ